jgi:2-polyprenyl-3-methyl-5-hydroxy-6-metoxy-1,4-benzoquinol methylase
LTKTVRDMDCPELESVACRLCGRRDPKPYAIKFGLTLVKCRSCGLVYAQPRLTEADVMKRYSPEYFYKEYLPVFRADETSFDLDLVRSHYHLYLQLLAPLAAPGRRLLDVGSGAGFFLKAAESAGWDVEGVEISPAAADYANRVLGVKVRQAKLEDVGFAPDTFDTVTLLDTIEHLGDPERAMAEIFRILKPGGRLILNTPDLRSISRRVLGESWTILTPAEHLQYYTAKTLRGTLEKTGFTVIGIRNLLNFNPECTHDKTSRRYRWWKRRLEREGTKKFLEKAFWIEYTDVVGLGGGRGDADSARPGLLRRMKRSAYRKAKRFLRGDVLVAIAEKPATASESIK